MPQYGWKNCPDSTRGQVSRLVSALRSRLERDLVGVYLHGSLAMGCFNPAASDVDLLAVTKGSPIVDAQKRIVEELLKLSKAPTPLEISILRTSDLAPWRHPTPYLLHYSEDGREQAQRDLADGAWRHWNDAPKVDGDLAAHITILHKYGVCLYGEPIEETFPAVPPADYLDSILSDLAWIKEHMEQHPASAVLTLCRVLAYVREGKILSKDEGGRWAMDKLPNPLLLPVRSAMQVYSGLYSEMYATPEQVKAFSDRLSSEIDKQLHPG
jgi:streptomycin 3"-adenylyltransferase